MKKKSIFVLFIILVSHHALSQNNCSTCGMPMTLVDGNYRCLQCEQYYYHHGFGSLPLLPVNPFITLGLLPQLFSSAQSGGGLLLMPSAPLLPPSGRFDEPFLDAFGKASEGIIELHRKIIGLAGSPGLEGMNQTSPAVVTTRLDYNPNNPQPVSLILSLLSSVPNAGIASTYLGQYGMNILFASPGLPAEGSVSPGQSYQQALTGQIEHTGITGFFISSAGTGVTIISGIITIDPQHTDDTIYLVVFLDPLCACLRVYKIPKGSLAHFLNLVLGIISNGGSTPVMFHAVGPQGHPRPPET